MPNALSPTDSVVFDFTSPTRIRELRNDLKQAREVLDLATIEYTKAQNKVAELTRLIDSALKS